MREECIAWFLSSCWRCSKVEPDSCTPFRGRVDVGWARCARIASVIRYRSATKRRCFDSEGE